MPPPAGGGNFLTRKFGPLPAWAWAGLAVGGYLVYRQRKAAKASAAAPTTTGLLPNPGVPAGSSGGFQAPSGYGYQGPGVGFGSQGLIPTGAMAKTAYSPPSVGPYLGAGFLPEGQNASNTASNPGTNTTTDAQGNVYTWLSPAEFQNLLNQPDFNHPGGTQVFYENLPGIFTPWTGQTIPGNTPLYALTGHQ